jgi:nucleotide-binding universal stress UspA family protein
MPHVFNRLLLATEHSEFDSGAEALALSLARRCGLPLAGVLPVVSNPEFEGVAPQLAARADAEASARRVQLEALARGQGVDFTLHVRRGQEPFAEIVDEARELAADLIVIRRRGKRGLLANLLVGEMVSKVVSHAPCSVLITPRGAQMWSRRVLVGLDPLQPDAATLALAADVAGECGLPLHLLCVIPGEASRAAAQQVLADALARVRERCAQADGECRVGRPHEQLIAAAGTHEADLVVIGRHHANNLDRAWIGGVAQKVIGLAECPVLVHVNPPAEKAAAP